MRRASSQDTIAAAIARVRRVSASATDGVAYISLPSPGAVMRVRLARALSVALEELGFHTIPPGDEVRDARAVHCAVIVCDEAGADTALHVLPVLVGAGPRAHVLIDLRDRTASPADPIPPRGHRWKTPRHVGDGGARPTLWLVREQASIARQGPVAVSTSASLGGGADAEVRVRALVADDRWREAATLSRASLRATTHWPTRVAIGCLAAHALTVCGDLASASALLRGLDAEARLRRCPVPGVVQVERASVHFWQGRFHAAEQALQVVEDCEGSAVLRALIRWARGDHAEMTTATRLLASARGSGDGGAFFGRLARLCQAELAVASGRMQQALALVGARSRGRETTRLDQAVADRLVAVAAGDRTAAASAAQFMRRSGALGISRWGLGRQGMQLWHAMPGLLNVVHEAEDEAAILAGSCRWLREQARADAAGFVSPRLDRWVASAAFTADDLASDLVRDAATGDGRTVARDPDVVVGVAVRWSGATSGYVLARGRASAAEAVADGARAVAALAAPALRARLDALALADAGDSLAPEILGISPAIADVRLSVARAAFTPFPVLIDGESGTGKELVARAVHRLSARRDRKFCAVNCAALTDELVEAELFGHSRGAFTGAVGARVGLFEEAHLGTLFLDEVSELSARAQAKVLRVLQEREIRRLGENGTRPIDVRIVAATNRPLTDGVVEGRFRHDLLFRLSVVRIALPPLRERPEDVPLLAQAFARRIAPDVGKRLVLAPDALAALARYSWPGNVRELQNAIAGLTVLAPGRGRVTARHVAQVLAAGDGSDEAVIVPLMVARETLERRLVAASLARNAGRRSAAARELGLSRQGLTKVIKRLGLAGVGRVA